MTLIGGFRANGTPVLFGDFLLTSQGRRKGLRRKIVRLSDNCALAWTGHELVANDVFKDLSERIQEPVISRSKLEELLTGYSDGHFASLSAHFIGWIIDQDASCFLWNSGYPSQLFYGEPQFDGSAGEQIAALIGSKNLVTPDGDTTNALLFLYSQFMREETAKGPNHTDLHGYAYEILVYSNRTFSFLSDITFASSYCELDERDRPKQWVHLEPVYKYRGFPQFAEVTTAYLSKKRVDVNFIRQPGNKTMQWLSERAHEIRKAPFKLRSIYYCISFTFVINGVALPPFHHIESDDMPEEFNLVKIIENSEIEGLRICCPQNLIDVVVRDWRSQQNMT